MLVLPLLLAAALVSPDAMDIARERPCPMSFKRDPSEVVLLARHALKEEGVDTEVRRLESVNFSCLGSRPVWRVMFRGIPAGECADCRIGVYIGDRDEGASIIRFG